MNKLWQKIFFVAGIFLLFIGLLIYAVYPFLWRGPIVSITGFLFITSYIHINRKTLANSISVRSAKYATNTVIFAIIIFLIVCLINVISLKARYKIDASVYGINSLTKQSKDILENLDKPVNIYAFIPQNEEGTKELFKSMCDNYNYESSGKVNCTTVNPDKHPELAKNFMVNSSSKEVYGISFDNKYTRTEFLSEEDFTSAIIKVTRNKPKTIYFTTQHGEGDLLSDADNGFNKLKYKLESLGYNTFNIAITSLQQIPQSCDVLVILAPKTQMLPSEIEKISNYLNSGGSVVFMIDPTVITNAEPLFENWGMRLGNDVVIDKLSNNEDPFAPAITNYPNNEITKKGDYSIPTTFFNEARSVMPIIIQKDKINVVPILITTPKASFAETDLFKYVEFSKVKYDPNKDIMGPISLACVATKTIDDKTHKLAKIAVFGDSDFVNNKSIDFLGNNVLALNLFSWLAGDNNLISLDKPIAKPNLIALSNANKVVIYYICLLIIPGIFIFIGIGIWWKKRKK